jgi:hypothetical protein
MHGVWPASGLGHEILRTETEPKNTENRIEKYRTEGNRFPFGSQLSGTERTEVNSVLDHVLPKYRNRTEIYQSAHLVLCEPNSSPPPTLAQQHPLTSTPSWRLPPSRSTPTSHRRMLRSGAPRPTQWGLTSRNSSPRRLVPLLHLASALAPRGRTLAAPPFTHRASTPSPRLRADGRRRLIGPASPSTRRPSLYTTRPCRLPRRRRLNTTDESTWPQIVL